MELWTEADSHPAPSTSAGLAYALPVELLLTTEWSDSACWSPGQLLDALSLTYRRARILLALCAASAVVVSTALFVRRDVAT